MQERIHTLYAARQNLPVDRAADSEPQPDPVVVSEVHVFTSCTCERTERAWQWKAGERKLRPPPAYRYSAAVYTYTHNGDESRHGRLYTPMKDSSILTERWLHYGIS